MQMKLSLGTTSKWAALLAGAALLGACTGSVSTTPGVGQLHAAVLGMRPGVPNGLRTGVANGLRVGTFNGLRVGTANGLRTGTFNGLRLGTPNGLRPGVPNGLAFLLPDGTAIDATSMLWNPSQRAFVGNGHYATWSEGIDYGWDADGDAVSLDLQIGTSPASSAQGSDPYAWFHNSVSTTAAAIQSGAARNGYYPSGFPTSLTTAQVQHLLSVESLNIPVLIFGVRPDDSTQQRTIDATFIVRALQELGGGPIDPNDWLNSTDFGDEIRHYVWKTAMTPDQSATDARGDTITGQVGLDPGALNGQISRAAVGYIMSAIASLQNPEGVHREIALMGSGQAPMDPIVAQTVDGYVKEEAVWTTTFKTVDPSTHAYIDTFPYAKVVAHVEQSHEEAYVIDGIDRFCAQLTDAQAGAPCFNNINEHALYMTAEVNVCSNGEAQTNNPSPSASPSYNGPAPSSSPTTGGPATQGGCQKEDIPAGSCLTLSATGSYDSCSSLDGDLASSSSVAAVPDVDGWQEESYSLTSYLDTNAAVGTAGGPDCFVDGDCGASAFCSTGLANVNRETGQGQTAGFCIPEKTASSGQQCSVNGVSDARICVSGSCLNGTAGQSAAYWNAFHGTNFAQGACL